MVSKAQVSVVPAGEGETIAFPLGNRAELKASGRHGLGFGFMRAVLPPGAGMPLLHLHRTTDEGFQIIDGQIEYRVGDRYVVAKGGDAVLIPAGVPHCFRAVGDVSASVVVIASSGSAMDMIEELSHGNLMDPRWTSDVLERFDSELLESHPHWKPGDPLRQS